VGVMEVVGVKEDKRVRDWEVLGVAEDETVRELEAEAEGVIETEGIAMVPITNTCVTGAEANWDPRGCSDTDTEGLVSLKRVRL
jgi:hypothetical protein